MDVRVGLWRKLSTEELMLLNCGVREDSWESLGLQGDPTIGKDSYAGRDWGQEEKGMTEDEVAGWHHRLNGHKFEWTPGIGDGQGDLASCSPWGRKESDMTEQLNGTELNIPLCIYTTSLSIHLWRTLRLLPYLDYCKLLQGTQRVSFLESRQSLIILQVERLWNLPHLFFMDVWSNKVGFRILHSVFEFLETCQINS